MIPWLLSLLVLTSFPGPASQSAEKAWEEGEKRTQTGQSSLRERSGPQELIQEAPHPRRPLVAGV